MVVLPCEAATMTLSVVTGATAPRVAAAKAVAAALLVPALLTLALLAVAPAAAAATVSLWLYCYGSRLERSTKRRDSGSNRHRS